MTRDAAVASPTVVVIGASAGGVEALPLVLGELPAGLPAAVCITLHIGASAHPYLLEILNRRSKLPVKWAEQGEALCPGHIYMAPPDLHLLLIDDHLTVSRGPPENHSRPSINQMFRSAAAQHGSRVIGVLLSGTMNDGVAGLQAIHAAGGMVIVQDPQGARFSEMPANAVQALNPALVLDVKDIGAALVRQVGQLGSHDSMVEAALWAAIRSLGERAAALEALSHEAELAGQSQRSQEHGLRAREVRAQVELCRQFMLNPARPWRGSEHPRGE